MAYDAAAIKATIGITVIMALWPALASAINPGIERVHTATSFYMSCVRMIRMGNDRPGLLATSTRFGVDYHISTTCFIRVRQKNNNNILGAPLFSGVLRFP